jgi:response regulator RpfG family c-di-GMP phosphodiesterase/signal transduction histidine kinase/HPt (histidine-containing phosphotransfer) domain-containing protein
MNMPMSEQDLVSANAALKESEGKYHSLLAHFGSELAARSIELAHTLAFKRLHEEQLAFLLDLDLRAPNLSEKAVCDIVLEMGIRVTRSRIGFLHLLDQDQKTVSSVIWKDESLRHCSLIHDTHFALSEAGIWADCVRTRHAVIYNDYQGIGAKIYPQEQTHLIRHMSVPVLDGDRVSMIVGVGNKGSDYTDDDARQLQWVVDEAQKIVVRRRTEAALKARTEELSAALDAAKVADLAKDEFLANISHELRTPLNVVIGLAGLALRNNVDPRQKDYLTKIGDAGKILTGIISDILDLSKIAAGRMELEATTFSLRALMRKIMSVMAHKAAEKGLSLIEKIGADVPDILQGDPLRLEQILLNLLSNAIKFTESGHVEVRVGNPRASKEAGICLEIEVEDSGIGISKVDIAQLFKAFSQADASMARNYGGTGLGLAICKRLAELMNGDISVTSHPGIGSNFQVRVWIAPGDETRLPTPIAAPQDANELLLVRYRDAQVLVVEDHPLNREIVRELLAAAGIAPIMATNGLEAVEMLAASDPGRFDLVLMDIQMPTMDGLSATREIRARAEFRELPIVSMTAHTLAHEIQVGVEAGITAHIGKPIDPRHFYFMLAKWIPEGKRRRHDAPIHGNRSRVERGWGSLRSVDTKGALERFAGNEELYRNWLMRFVDDAAGEVSKIRQALVDGDQSLARKSAHAFKGQTGTLGLIGLHATVTALEAAIAQGRPADTLQVAMEHEVGRVCTELTRALALDVAQPGHARPSMFAGSDVVERRDRSRKAEKLILLIDDDAMTLEALDECLRPGFQTRLAACGVDGLEMARLLPQPDLILLDIELPDVQGLDICRALKSSPETAAIPIIFLSSHADAFTITQGLEMGAVDFVTKPVVNPILLARVETHLRLQETSDLLRNQNVHLETLVGERTRDLEARTNELQQNQDLTIVALGSIAETRDNETGNHINRTRAYVELLARRLALKTAYQDIVKGHDWEMIWKSAPLHDIGKVGIPDHILLKPGPLTREEFEVMKRHTVLGRNAIRSAEIRTSSEDSFLRTASEIACSHHERWDGKGYPEGLCGGGIPLAARMMAVADVYDALTSDRVYKAAIPHSDAVELIRAGSGSQFDPEIVTCFMEMTGDFLKIAAKFSDVGENTEFQVQRRHIP